MKVLLTWLFGQYASAIPSENNSGFPNSLVKSSYPENRPDFETWAREFRVSMLHGRSIVHM